MWTENGWSMELGASSPTPTPTETKISAFPEQPLRQVICRVSRNLTWLAGFCFEIVLLYMGPRFTSNSWQPFPLGIYRSRGTARHVYLVSQASILRRGGYVVSGYSMNCLGNHPILQLIHPGHSLSSSHRTQWTATEGLPMEETDILFPLLCL